MTDNEKLKIGMYESVISYLFENRDIISTIRGFTSSINKLRKVIDEIKRKEKELSSDILEKTIISSKAKEDMIVSVIPLAQAIFNYAKQTGNIQLKEKSRLSHSMFERMRDSQLLDKCTMIHMLGAKYISSLAPYAISEDTINNVGTKIEEYRHSLGQKISSFISSDTVVSMNLLFEESDFILMKQMDNYMEILSDEYVEFYDDYLIVRSLEYQDLKNELQEEEEDEE